MDSLIGARFVKETSYCDFSQTPRRQGEPAPDARCPADPSLHCIPLPDVHCAPHAPLDVLDAVLQRRSKRVYSTDALSLSELSYLLFCMQGIQGPLQFHTATTYRTVPSAGARHPFETMVYVRLVDGLSEGLYRYDPYEHVLFAIPTARTDFADAWTKAMASNAFERKAAVTFAWVAIPERVTWHHGQRGYRNLFIEAGHMCQNLYLTAETIDCGVCAINVFDDTALNELCGLDEQCAFVVYAACIGKLITEG